MSTSWDHRASVSFEGFIAAYRQCGTGDDERGFVVRFEREVLTRTLDVDSVYMRLRWIEESDRITNPADDMPLGVRVVREQRLEYPVRVEGVRVPTDGVDPDNGLIRAFEQLEENENPERANGVRLWVDLDSPHFSDHDVWRRILVERAGGQRIREVAIVLRGVMIADADGDHHALDGDHIAPYVPDRPSGNGTEGGDWVGVLRLQ